jgi:hypothetical protein
MDSRIVAANAPNSAECQDVQKALPVRSHEGPLRVEGECPAQNNATTTNSVHTHTHTHMTCVHTFGRSYFASGGAVSGGAVSGGAVSGGAVSGGAVSGERWSGERWSGER